MVTTTKPHKASKSASKGFGPVPMGVYPGSQSSGTVDVLDVPKGVPMPSKGRRMPEGRGMMRPYLDGSGWWWIMTDPGHVPE